MTSINSPSVLTPQEIGDRLQRQPRSGRTLFNSLMTGIAGTFTGLVIIPLFSVLFYVLFQGFRRLDLDLFTQLPPPPGLTGGGLGNAIVGTLIVVSIAIVIAVPFGILAAVYLTEFSQDNQFARAIRFATNILAGVPSIIAGVFIYGLLVATQATGYSAIAGGIALSVMMIPTIVRTTDEALKIVPQEMRWAAVGLGTSNYQTALQIVIPAAFPSILTGIVLSVARAAGETAPLIFTALNSPFWPAGLLRPIASLSVTVYSFATVPFPGQQELAWAGALILVTLVLIASVTARYTTKQKSF